MKLRCLIIDDEPLAHDVIVNYCADVQFLTVVGQCYRATDALEMLNNTAVDLIFLDIRMPKLTGLDLLKALERKPLVIVTSAFEEYALESFDLAVCDYLLKPIRFERFLKAVNRALELFTLKSGVATDGGSSQDADRITQYPDSNTQPIQITLKTDKKHVNVYVGEIEYLESLGNYVKVWQEGKFLLTARTLSGFEEQLPTQVFLRIHKSYIINRSFVHYIEGNMVYLKDGTQLPVGKNYKGAAKQLLA